MLDITSVSSVTLIETPSRCQLNVLFGPPSAEQVRVTLSPVSTVTSLGDIVTVSAGDTNKRTKCYQ